MTATVRQPMAPRAVDEPHRVSTPLELLFDLTVVVAVARAAAELAHTIEAGHLGSAPVSFLMVFFAVWWAWMNFSWFASAYDVDDVPYRLLTLVQMAGVLVLAAGVPAAFEDGDLRAVTVGYVVMRVALIVQWLRAAAADPERRMTALRYAAGISVVQVGWLLRLLLSGPASGASSAALVIAELMVPLLAERGSMTTWHPHHIAERYGLLTIIVLGESVLGVSVAIAPQVGDHPLQPDLLLVAGGGLLLLFALWWVYFLKPAGRTLEERRDWAFRWGYGHYGVFASLAALGAGLEVAAVRALHPVQASDPAIAWAVSLPVAVFLLLIWALHLPSSPAPVRQGVTVGVLALLTLVPPVGCSVGLPLPWAVVATALPPVALVVLGVARASRDQADRA